MREWLKELDELLRGSKTDPGLLAQGTAHIRLKPLGFASVALAVVYGVCMGCFAVFNRTDPQYLQLLASGIKVPALFFLTLLVTFPSLYVFSALLGVRLGPLDTLRMVVAALAVNITVLASFALMTLFFTFCTTSYPFLKVLNFAFFAAAGLIGLRFLMNMLERLDPTPPPPPPPEPGEGPPTVMSWPLPPRSTTARQVFGLWVVLYGFVGAQMGWVLRPFIGTPGMPFTWLRAREANIFIDLVRTIGELFG